MSRIPSDVANVFLGKSSEQATQEPSLERLDDSAVRSGDGNFVGSVYYCPTYDCNAYWSTRTHDDHLYQKDDAYPIDVSIIERLQTEFDNVEKIFIGERQEREVFEFDFEQYADGKRIHHPPHSPQLHTPIEQAVEVWEDALDSMRAD